MLIPSMLRVALASFVLASLVGCGSLQVKSASASVKLNVGVLGLEANVEVEPKPKEELSSFGAGLAPAVLMATSRIELTSSNASIPDQVTLATLSIRDEYGALVAAQTFRASVASGEGSFSDPAEVEAWLASIAVPGAARISVVASDLEIVPPSEGAYSATSKIVVANQVVASSTASGYISPGRGDRPPTRPK